MVSAAGGGWRRRAALLAWSCVLDKDGRHDAGDGLLGRAVVRMDLVSSGRKPSSTSVVAGVDGVLGRRSLLGGVVVEPLHHHCRLGLGLSG